MGVSTCVVIYHIYMTNLVNIIIAIFTSHKLISCFLGTVGFKYGMSCNKYPLNPNDKDDDSYFDVVTGKMLVPFMPSPLLDGYCIEMVEKKSRIKPDKLYRFVCFPEEEDNMREQKLHYFGIVSFSLLFFNCLKIRFWFL